MISVGPLDGSTENVCRPESLAGCSELVIASSCVKEADGNPSPTSAASPEDAVCTSVFGIELCHLNGGQANFPHLSDVISHVDFSVDAVDEAIISTSDDLKVASVIFDMFLKTLLI